MGSKMSKFKFLSDPLSDMMSCDGWPDSYQERNALKRHCMNTMTHWEASRVINGRMQTCHDATAIKLS